MQPSPDPGAPSAATRTAPPRALAISIGALSIPLAASTLLSGWLESGNELLIWLPAIVPAFLLAFHRGWHGASVSLALGMATLALSQSLVLLMDLPMPGWGHVFGVVVILLSVSLGAGWMAESLLQARETAEEAAFTDTLTGLPNRRHASAILDAGWGVARRGAGSLAVVIFDVDHFKRVNDSQGHVEGDRVLKEFAGVLSHRTRRMDLSARFGGEEFISILLDCSIEGAASFAESVREKLANLDFGWGNVTASAGVAAFEPGMGSPDILVAAADRALYAAKEQGRNRVCRADEAVAAPQVATKPVTHARTISEIHILVVDDDLDALNSTAELLKGLGSDCTLAASPRAALDILASGVSFDLLVTDLVMPEMSGFTLVDLATIVSPGLPVLFISGYEQEEIYWGGTPGARSAFIPRPIDEDRLIEAVNGLMDPAAGAQEAAGKPAEVLDHSGNGFRQLLNSEASGDERILVVDDDPAKVQALLELFRESGYPVLGLTDPRKVSQVYRESRFDLIVLDLEMPGMDGFQVMTELADLVEPDEYLPILVLAGRTDVNGLQRALAAGAADFLREPFDPAEAQARVRGLLTTRKLAQRVASLRHRRAFDSP